MPAQTRVYGQVIFVLDPLPYTGCAYLLSEVYTVDEFTHIGIKENGKKRNNSKEIAGNEAANYQKKKERCRMDEGYFVRFIRKDNKPVEEFFYHDYEDALDHLALFRDDDSGLYKRIELVTAADDAKSLITQLF